MAIRACAVGHLALGEARHEVALRDEAGVDPEPLPLPGVELPAEQPEPDRRLGAALGPHHAGRPGARTRAERAAARPGRRRRARPRAGTTRTRRRSCRRRRRRRLRCAANRWSRLRPSHRLNSQSIDSEMGEPMYGLTPEDLDLQRRAREFTDELIPFEVEAETHGGRLPDEVAQGPPRAGHRARPVRDQHAHVGRRPGLYGAPAGARPGAGRAGHQRRRPGCCATPPSWWPEVANDHQRETWLLPTVRGEKEECYAITEEGAGSDVSDLTATARRDGDEYVLDGVKWHVTSFNEADYVFFQAVLTTGPHAGEQALFVLDKDTPGVRVVRTPDVHAHARARAPDRRLRGGAGAGEPPGRERGGRHVLRLRVVPLRAADGRRPVPRRRRAARRRGDRVRASSGSSAASR